MMIIVSKLSSEIFLLKQIQCMFQEDGYNNNHLKMETVYVLKSKDKTFGVKTESVDDTFIKVDAIFVPKL